MMNFEFMYITVCVAIIKNVFKKNLTNGIIAQNYLHFEKNIYFYQLYLTIVGNECNALIEKFRYRVF